MIGSAAGRLAGQWPAAGFRVPLLIRPRRRAELPRPATCGCFRHGPLSTTEAAKSLRRRLAIKFPGSNIDLPIVLSPPRRRAPMPASAFPNQRGSAACLALQVRPDRRVFSAAP